MSLSIVLGIPTTAILSPRFCDSYERAQAALDRSPQHAAVIGAMHHIPRPTCDLHCCATDNDILQRNRRMRNATRSTHLIQLRGTAVRAVAANDVHLHVVLD